ncbi:hypothetical protein OVA21_03885 [Dietzia sp. SL131]|uniref:hypothetical protein n=1 Tax=Dietzia sp. SL131 TaxID=2995149 RepID=UPI00227B0F1D|nr:hypothetical protein [Dietzia sp. SL131]MCY1656361.1 hypothetical protein [Dietzia sp. SL131]
MPILTGTIDDVTGSPLPDRVPLATLRVTVRAPSRRSSLTEQVRLVASVPVPVEVSPTGEISVELEPGPAVMLVEGEGLRDVYELGVTADMTLLTEALQEMSPTRSWVESQMVQLRSQTVTAAGDAQTAKSDAEGAASVAEGHRTHVDAIRQTLDEAAQSNVAPYLTQSELNATYGTKAEVEDLDSAKLDKIEASATYASLSDVFDGGPLKRAVATFDAAYEPAEDGTLVLILGGTPPPETQFFTDFSENTIGQPPAGWSTRWRDTNMWTVQADAAGLGGVILKSTAPAPTGETNRVLAWDAIGSGHSNVEVVLRWSGNSAAVPVRPVVRGAGTAATPTGYVGGSQNATTDSLQSHPASATLTTLGTAARTFSANTWYITRLRAEGSVISSRTWLDSTPEPTAWDFQVTDTAIPGPGWVGLRVFSLVGEQYVDWVGVGVDGVPAPTEAV